MSAPDTEGDGDPTDGGPPPGDFPPRPLPVAVELAEPPGAAGSDGVAAAGVLRRVQVLAAVWGLVAGLGLAAHGGWRRGVVLTLAAAVSIVALRSLEGVVRRLQVQSSADQVRSPANQTQSPADEGTPDSLGVGYVLRVFLLAVLVTILALGGRDPLALLLGLSAVPVALIGEALLQVLALRGEARREGGGHTGDGRGREP